MRSPKSHNGIWKKLVASRYAAEEKHFAEQMQKSLPAGGAGELPEQIGFLRGERQTGSGRSGVYISLRFSSDFEIVTSSENSMSLPTGMPIAMRVTFIPSGFSNRDR